MKPFPWHAAIGFGLGVLKLPPETFWRMTPRELALAIRALRRPEAEPISRETLDALGARFPDSTHEEATI